MSRSSMSSLWSVGLAAISIAYDESMTINLILWNTRAVERRGLDTVLV